MDKHFLNRIEITIWIITFWGILIDDLKPNKLLKKKVSQINNNQVKTERPTK